MNALLFSLLRGNIIFYFKYFLGQFYLLIMPSFRKTKPLTPREAGVTSKNVFRPTLMIVTVGPLLSHPL